MGRIYNNHGLRYTREYNIWSKIKARCFNENEPSYYRYGGRGITMCDEWKHDPVAFCNYILTLDDYDKDGYTLDREDNEGNYEPDNLRWVSPHIQNINQRKQKSNTTGYIGVSNKGNRFVATIGRTYVATKKTIIEAAEARDWYIIKNGLWEYPLQVIRKEIA